MGCALAALAATGCVTLRPYAEVAAALSPEVLFEIDGQRVHVEVQGEGFPLVLLHGFGASTLIWQAVLPGLGRHRRTVALDLNGFGWTERPAEREAYTLEGQERLVLAVADRLGLARFDLAGHSYGGGLALFMAARHPERVRALLLVDSTLPDYGTLRRNRIFASRTVARFFTLAVALREGRVRWGLEASYADDAKVTDELVRAYLERLRIEGVEDAFVGLTAPTGRPADRVDLAALGQPTHFVWGAEDELIRAAEGRAAAEQVPDATFVEIPGCGHSPMEECPAEFLAAVEPFLERSIP